MVHSFNGFWHLVITNLPKNVRVIGSWTGLYSGAPYRGLSACPPHGSLECLYLGLHFLKLVVHVFILPTCAVSGGAVYWVRFEAVFLLCIFYFVSSLWWPVQVQQLSKMEVEDLLRKGAYGALMDEEDEGSKFCEEDIDQILQRRTHTITIQSEGQGSTFAKVQGPSLRSPLWGARRKVFGLWLSLVRLLFP